MFMYLSSCSSLWNQHFQDASQYGTPPSAWLHDGSAWIRGGRGRRKAKGNYNNWCIAMQCINIICAVFVDNVILYFYFQHPMKPAMIPRPGMMQKPQQHMVYSGSSVASQPPSLTHRSQGAWQSTLSGEDGRDGRGGLARQLVIPRAKVKPRQQSNYQDYSDDDCLSAEVCTLKDSELESSSQVLS